VGVGYQHEDFKDTTPVHDYDAEKQLGLKGGPLKRNFPQFRGLEAARGGVKDLGPGAQSRSLMIKPTGNASLTWIKNNHTYKFGTEFRMEGYPNQNFTMAAGVFTFNAAQTGLPYVTQGLLNLGGGTVGFPYASFLLGLVNNGDVASVTDTRFGKTQSGFFAQDTWKVTRTLTLDYGLRYDYSTYFKEQYGRSPNFSPTTPNPAAGGFPGASVFEGNGPGRCNCSYAENYPWAFGPRLGAALRVSPRTVVRIGWGISYDGTSNIRGGATSTNPFASAIPGEAAMRLRDGIPLGGAEIAWPRYDAGLFPVNGNPIGGGAPIAFDPNSGRPPRMVQWSIGVQREIFSDLVVEASYVGNRGVWWQANSLQNINALTPERLASFGLNINNAADRTLLTSRLDSAVAAQRGFSRPPYAGFPLTATVAQSLRPFPQFETITSSGTPQGNTWYDSLQIKATKRLSHGLDFNAAFAWQKELNLGIDNAAATTAINDVFNRQQNKYISANSRPLTLVIAGNYQFPQLSTNTVLSAILRNWRFGTVLRYASGQPIRVPLAQNNLNTLLFRGADVNTRVPASGTFANRVPGEPLFTKDLNCHCFDPNREFVLNPAAWADPPAGQFSDSPAYHGDYRQQRRPQESVSLGRTFGVTEGTSLQVRLEFSNVFNRTFMDNPVSTNARLTQTTALNGNVISGFGRIDTGALISGTGANFIGRPREGLLVIRLRF
jgi:hypothetical protein